MLVLLRSFDSVVFLECELSCRREPLVKFHVVGYCFLPHLLDGNISSGVISAKLLDRVLSIQDWSTVLRDFTILIRLESESDGYLLSLLLLLRQIYSLMLLLSHLWQSININAGISRVKGAHILRFVC